MKLALLTLILSAFALTVSANANCLAGYEGVISSIANVTNTSNATVFQMFLSLCNDNYYNSSVTYNTSMTYNKTESDSLLASYNESINRTVYILIPMEISRYNSTFNQTLYDINSRTLHTITDYNETIGQRQVEFEDILDKKIDTFKVLGATRDDLLQLAAVVNDTINNNTIRQNEYYTRLIKENTTMYKFAFPVVMGIGAVGIIMMMLYRNTGLGRFLPKNIKQFQIRERTLEDLVTPTTVRDKVERIRKLKLSAVRSKLPAEAKNLLLMKIDNGEITNEAEMEEEKEIWLTTRKKK